MRHYQELLEKAGVKGVVTQVIALRELKVEYTQFEEKIQLSHKFDVFLADSRIIRLLPKFLGKNFYKNKKLPVQVNMTAKDLRAEFTKCLNTTQLPMKHTGATSSVTVGHTSMTPDTLVDNITTVTKQLDSKYPGGMKNIRSIHLLSDNTSLPLYISLRPTSQLELVSGRKRKIAEAVTDELSTIVGGVVTVTPGGKVTVKRTADPEWTHVDETLKEFSKAEEEQNYVDDEEEDEEKAEVKKNEKNKKDVDNDSEDDEIDDQELEYMKKVAEEEEEMEKELEKNDEKMKTQLENKNESEDDDECDDVDDDAEAENLVDEDDDSDSDTENITMRKTLREITEEIENDPPEQPKKSKKQKASKMKTKVIEKPMTKQSAKPSSAKEKKKQKFVAQKKSEKMKKSNKK